MARGKVSGKPLRSASSVGKLQRGHPAAYLRRGGAGAKAPRRRHPHRQGLRRRGRRQHPLDAGLHAHGRARPRRDRLRARHAGGDAAPGRRGLLRAARTRGARDRAMDRVARRRIPPADLLSRQGAAAHPAGRSGASIFRELTRRQQADVIFRLAVRRKIVDEGGAVRGVRVRAAGWLRPVRWCSPAAASGQPRHDARHFGSGGEGIRCWRHALVSTPDGT